MKIELVSNSTGTTVGYKICAETKSDHKVLDEVRNLHFYGEGEHQLEYYKMDESERYPELVAALDFRTLSHIKEIELENKKLIDQEKQETVFKQHLLELGFIQTGDGTFAPSSELFDFQLTITPKTTAMVADAKKKVRKMHSVNEDSTKALTEKITATSLN